MNEWMDRGSEIVNKATVAESADGSCVEDGFTIRLPKEVAVCCRIEDSSLCDSRQGYGNGSDARRTWA